MRAAPATRSTHRRRLLGAAAMLLVLAVSACTATSVPTGGHHPAGSHTVHFRAGSLGPDWGVYDSGPYDGSVNGRSPALAVVRDHVLHLTTRGPTGSGVCLCQNGADPTRPYGRWDVRARVSTGAADHGYAILLWPEAENWPVGGELDLAEFPDPDRARVQTSVHFGADNQQLTRFTPGDFTRWHTYSVIWTPTSVTYEVDGRTVFRVTDPAAIPHGAMHLAFQAGVNPGVSDPSDTTSTLDVAWVRVTPGRSAAAAAAATR